ncbi:response regulator [Patescibacteria group bacterium]|nr:response regulator [Patescibacteria group bacterium]
MNQDNKILIVEDEQVLGELLLSKFKSEGYDAFWEMNGEDGLRKMRELLPNLVLLDLVMPKKDGYEVLDEMRNDEVLKKIPVVIISNSGQPVEIEKILELGAKDYIIKAQFSPEEVLEKVQKYLNQEVAPKHANKNASGIKILVVEDDTFLSSLEVERFKKEGYNVKLASDGTQALKDIEADIPDLMLLDIVMPGMNGFDVLRKVKADPKYKDMMVIVFSNLGQEQEIEECKKLGADDFLVKANFTLKEVVDKINALLKKKGRI